MDKMSHVPSNAPSIGAESFSLVVGGPLFQLWRRTGLSGDGLELLYRRLFFFFILTWVPLLAFSLADGRAWGPSLRLPFLRDIEIHARLLLSLPLMLYAELLVEQRMRPLVGQFVTCGLIPDSARPVFDAALSAARDMRNSLAPELALLACVYVVGVAFIWPNQVGFGIESWYGVTVNERLVPTHAGWWMGCVSLPVFQFLLLRWYFRLFIWARFLWGVSRIHLLLNPMHPDRCGGLGFLASLSKVFAPVLFAQGLLWAGLIANRIFFLGVSLVTFKMELISFVVGVLATILGPLLVFLPQLSTTKRRGLLEYGVLAARYTREFELKWLRGGAPLQESFLGSPDIQSLADLGNSYTVIKEMRLVPFNANTALEVVLATLFPVVPLTLTMIPLEELLGRLLKLLF